MKFPVSQFQFSVVLLILNITDLHCQKLKESRFYILVALWVQIDMDFVVPISEVQ